MSATDHARYTAADRFERKAARRKRPQARRQGTRHAVIAAALQAA